MYSHIFLMASGLLTGALPITPAKAALGCLPAAVLVLRGAFEAAFLATALTTFLAVVLAAVFPTA